MYRPFVIWLCAVLLSVEQASSSVVQLADGNFTSYLGTLPETSDLVIEFYANWCPHCRHFAPTYEQVGQFFSEQQVHAPITIARVDCALEVRTSQAESHKLHTCGYQLRFCRCTPSPERSGCSNVSFGRKACKQVLYMAPYL
jgi:thiol-disulfide isomerase/thioredoxin